MGKIPQSIDKIFFRNLVSQFYLSLRVIILLICFFFLCVICEYCFDNFKVKLL